MSRAFRSRTSKALFAWGTRIVLAGACYHDASLVDNGSILVRRGVVRNRLDDCWSGATARSLMLKKFI